MVDWDEDGDVDLICGESDGHIHYFENIGTVTNPVLRDNGHINAGGSPIDVYLSIPVVHDWDEDGRKDIVLGNDATEIKIYLNTGTNANPSFTTYYTLVTNPAITQIKGGPDVADLNGDGLKDIAFGWWQGTVVYYPNSGTNTNPIFNSDHELNAVGTIIDPGGWTHLETNDWDEDGDIDLVYGEWNGEVYIHYNITDEFETVATPQTTPIQIPASGGSFEFEAEFFNNSDYNANADVWTVAKLPNGSETASLLLAHVNIASGANISRIRTQSIPDYAPSGDYEYILRWGVYPGEPFAESSFEFEKLATDLGGTLVNNWECGGESFEEPVATLAPESYTTLTAYPNPFNPTTSISFELRDAQFASLRIYDVQGRQVDCLNDVQLSAGKHEFVFDGSGLSSGMYFAILEAGDLKETLKLLLMK